MNVESVPTIPIGWRRKRRIPSMCGPGRHLVGAEVLGQEQVAQRVDRVVAGLVDQVAEGQALEREQRRPLQVADPDVAQPAGAGEEHATLGELPPDAVSDAGSARRSLVLIGPPAWTHGGIRISSRVLAHSAG